MLRHLGALLLLLVALPALADQAPPDYWSLLAAAKRGDQPIDWRALRFAYAESPDFDLLGVRTIALRKKMFAAFQARDYPAAARAAAQLLDLDFVDLDAHEVSDAAFTKLGDAAQATFHHDAMLGLVASIRSSDGQSADNALTVISVGEEFELLRVLGMRRTRETRFQDGEHSYDRLDAVDRDGKPQSFFFLIDRVLAAETKARDAKP